MMCRAGLMVGLPVGVEGMVKVEVPTIQWCLDDVLFYCFGRPNAVAGLEIATCTNGADKGIM